MNARAAEAVHVQGPGAIQNAEGGQHLWLLWLESAHPSAREATLTENTDEGDFLPVSAESPTPHLDKLKELLNNHKLPEPDRASVAAAIEKHQEWVGRMDALETTGAEKVKDLVELLNEYKRFVELELIWDSEADFLFRQRGQLKLDNSIIEEFLPRLADPKIIPALEGKSYVSGPRTTYSAAYFATTLVNPSKGAGLQVRGKDQDFTVSREAYLQASFDAGFPGTDTVTHKIYLGFAAAECKTNLDKTMFQEAIATAHDVKIAVPGSRYFLLCEWLDMTPISTTATDIDEVLILRGKRIASNVRSKFSSGANRKENRDWYLDFLSKNPIRLETVLRFVQHLEAAFSTPEPEEDDVLKKGYF